MKKALICGVLAFAFASVALTAPASSCIYSGSTSRPCSFEAYGGLDELDSFCWWLLFGNPLAKFTSYPPTPFMYLMVR